MRDCRLGLAAVLVAVVCGCGPQNATELAEVDAQRQSIGTRAGFPSFPWPTLPGYPVDPDPDPPPDEIEGLPIWLVELEVHTADVSGASTDDTVTVQLHDDDWGSVKLERIHDNFKRGRTERYVLNNAGVDIVADIEEIRLSKAGTDGWCIDDIALFINNAPTPIFRRTFSSPHCIDGDNGHEPTYVISSRWLRRDMNWKLAAVPDARRVPDVVSKDILLRIAEAGLGHAVRDSNLRFWTGAPLREPEEDGAFAFVGGYFEGHWWRVSQTDVFDASLRPRCLGGRLEFSVSLGLGPDLRREDFREEEFDVPMMDAALHEAFFPLRHLGLNRESCTEDPVFRNGDLVTMMR